MCCVSMGQCENGVERMVTYANDDDDDDYDEGIRGITNGYVLIKTLVVTMRTRWDASYSST